VEGWLPILAAGDKEPFGRGGKRGGREGGLKQGFGVRCGVWGGCGMMGSPTQISHTALF